MATPTGIDWSAWAAMQKSGGDWTADAIADNATETGDELDLDVKAACEIGIDAVEDNTGAINGVVTVYILRYSGGTWQEPGVGNVQSFTFTPIQNDTVPAVFSVNPRQMGSLKLAVKNEGGQELALTIKYRLGTVPVAVA